MGGFNIKEHPQAELPGPTHREEDLDQFLSKEWPVWI